MAKKFSQDRKLWYKCFKKILKVRYKKPKYVFLGEKPNSQSIILSNHEGTDAPMSLEIYADFPVRMWGTYQMNSGLIKMYKYQTEVYYHQKKHWNLFLARLFCLLASPLTNLFYKGLNLISTYPDTRFIKTLLESVDAIEIKKENIVIFPEKSPDGYLTKIKEFYGGFLILCQKLYRTGIDVDVYVAYYNKSKRQYVFSASEKYSKLISQFKNRDEICAYLVEKCNSLGQI